jgi:hypothetical protein
LCIPAFTSGSGQKTKILEDKWTKEKKNKYAWLGVLGLDPPGRDNQLSISECYFVQVTEELHKASVEDGLAPEQS